MDLKNLNIKQNFQYQMFFVKLTGGNAYLKYRRPSENLIEFYETYVPESSRNKGIGSELVSFGIDYARENNFEILARCPFFRKSLKQDPEHKAFLHDYPN
jgi:predicted GNAT family acetyltransferase